LTTSIELLVTDFDFKDALSGLNIARAFRARFLQLPIVLVTGNLPDDPTVQEFLSIPLTALICKPFVFADLLQTIEKLFFNTSSEVRNTKINNADH